MTKDAAQALRGRIAECIQKFNDPTREYNTTGETVIGHKIKPLSEDVAAVTLEKNTGKKALAIFILQKKYWFSFFPTDSHILGLGRMADIKEQIEAENFGKNFEDGYGADDEFPPAGSGE